jgi:cell division protein FtsL
MLALAGKSRVYPVLLPRKVERGAPRRVRTSPAMRAVGLALVLLLPAVSYVYARTQVARTGYEILQLQRDVAVLQAERDRLIARAVALKTPDRIEDIATSTLGMAPPRQQQLATLPLAPAVANPVGAGRRTAWDYLRSWFGGEAEAHEPR